MLSVGVGATGDRTAPMLMQSRVQQSSLHLEKGEEMGPIQTRWHFRVSQAP